MVSSRARRYSDDEPSQLDLPETEQNGNGFLNGENGHTSSPTKKFSTRSSRSPRVPKISIDEMEDSPRRNGDTYRVVFF